MNFQGESQVTTAVKERSESDAEEIEESDATQEAGSDHSGRISLEDDVELIKVASAEEFKSTSSVDSNVAADDASEIS